MQSMIAGKAYVLGDNLDTDQIIPAQYLTFNPSIPEEYKQFGKYALSSVPPAQAGLPKGHVPFHTKDEFVSDYKIIIGGKNFGAIASWTSNVSMALQTDGRWTLAFIQMRSAISGDASSSTYTWQTPFPWPSTGTDECFMTWLIISSDPRAIIRSTR